MQHLDPDDLALAALGEDLGSTVDAHLRECAACTAEIETFRATVGLAELSNYGEDAPPPGEHVWQAIAAELGFTGAGAVATIDQADRTAPVTGYSTPPPPVVSAQQLDGRAGTNGTPTLRSVPPPAGDSASMSAAEPMSAADTVSSTDSVSSTGPQHPSTPVPPARPPNPPTLASGPGSTTPARWSRWIAPLAAAVVGVAIGAGAVVISQSQTDNVTIEAIAPLKSVPDGPLGSDTGTLGEAELVAAPSGQQVRVSADQLPQSPNAYEVWLFGDDGRMVSLGTLNDRSGSFTVPQGINTQEYRVVDISDESPDGNPLHSGISLIRGEFS